MENYEDIENIIELLDSKMGIDGINRINLQMSEDLDSGEVAERYHHGRCDVGSPWATGKIRNESLCDI